jgi:type III restriction enzyme
MELKQYQKQVIQDLTEFCNTLNQSSNPSEAFQKFWNNKGVLVKTADTVDGIDAYKDNIKGVPHVCMKVPTAGGKTFIASNSIKTIFNYLPITQTKAVIWLVPSNTILDQTLKNLSDPEHPYRQKINSHFNSAVEVFSKEDLLMGRGFNSTSVKEQLSIMVISYDSFRSNNKDGRKAYQDNANLTSFQSNYTSEDVSLMSIIRSLNPVVIVDESHNAETDLSVEMLKDLNPSFILDLTATPRNNSNIISYVDSIELKKENMVKLPVIVYNHAEVNDVITSAYELRNSLEQKAIVEEKAGGEYIRPIVLFQAQPKGREDSETFEKIKEKLIKKGIPEEQIKIKTANKDEIKNLDLMSRDCPVRYIITVNALKEGWDCPFAYILASVANRSSRVDVEQILGRILRQPYVTKHKEPLLNMSYVFTSSAFFFGCTG